MATPVTARVRRRDITSSSSLTPSAQARPFRRLTIVYQPIDALRPASRQVRRHSERQREKIKANITQCGVCAPISVTASNEIIDGHAVYEACKELGHSEIATTPIDDLSEDEVRRLRIFLNRISEESVWDLPELKAEFEHLFEADPALLHLSGFETAEVDNILMGLPITGPDPADEVPESGKGAPVSRVGDLWTFAGGRHKLLCGSAREKASYEALLGSEQVQMVCTDPPYGCPIKGHVSRSHGEFVEGSGMSEAETLAFFSSFLGAMVDHLQAGAMMSAFIDWRGMAPLVTAMREAGLEQKTLCAWDKQAGGMGSLYRQQLEFVVIAKKPGAPHINNVELGKHGRNRTTLWSYPGLGQFGRGRKEALAMHATVKPVGLIADSLLDTSRPGGVVLDPFAGSGTLLLAAHRTKRLGRALELHPPFVDVAVKRMEALTGEPGVNAATGLSFAETAEKRAGASDIEAAPCSSTLAA